VGLVVSQPQQSTIALSLTVRLDIDLDRELWRGVEARAEEGWAWRVTAPVATTGVACCGADLGRCELNPFRMTANRPHI